MTVKTIQFDQLQETVYHEKMESGLDVYVLPKQGFNKTYATFTTKYGSVDNEFVPLGKEDMIRVPDGIAHFLEHKLFEKKMETCFILLVNKEHPQTLLQRLQERLIYSQAPQMSNKTLRHSLILFKSLILLKKQSKKKRASLAKRLTCMMTIRTGVYSLV